MPTMLRMIFEEYLVKALNDNGFEVKFNAVEKANGIKYRALTLKDTNVSPALNVDALFEEFRSTEKAMGADKAMAKCVDKATDIFRLPVPTMDLAPQDMTNWSTAKDYIYPRLVPKTDNNLQLPHRDVADLCVIFTIRAYADNSGIGEAVIQTDLMNDWGVDADTIYDKAMDNLTNEDFKLMDMMDIGMMYVLSNKHGCKGAVECINPKVIEHIRDNIGDVYVVPSSVDEVLLIPRNIGFKGNDDVDCLKDMVREVNDSTVEEKDRLSYNVYEYVDGVLEVVK